MIEEKYSTFWPRCCAGVMDTLIFAPFVWLAIFVNSHSSVFVRLPLYLLCSSSYLAYSIFMHARYGQTLGKRACKVIVLDVSETPIRFKQAVLRDILGVLLLPIGWLVNIPKILHGVDIYMDPNVRQTTLEWIISCSTNVWFVVEVITMLTNDKRRALHDLIAGTVVVQKPCAAPKRTPTSPFGSAAA